ncbi:MAG: GAF domain-containing protein [Spirochaetes bacterium]|jgi:sigma-B regulation protein RsbU (phosphoserine phosphatase)|nr:GAF domain-containing protein [Spirochaetota bacterium]
MGENENLSIDFSELKYLERQLHNLSRLVEINGIINSTLDIAKLLTLVMEIIKEIMDTEASTLLLYEEPTRELVFKVALGEAGKELQERYRVKVGQGIAGWVAENRTTVYINDAYADERFDPSFDAKTGFTTRSMLCAPLLFKGRLVGVIQAINPVNRPGFDEEDVVLFNAFATQCVLAVQNAIFFQNALEEERIKNELLAAHSIQQSLLPVVSRRHGNVAIGARSISAREVGGEFYDIFFLKDNSIAVALGDLHTKGIPGALYASVVNGAVKALSHGRSDNPAGIISFVQDIIRDHMNEAVSLSLFYGILKCDDNTVRFASTGIAYPILVREGVARYLRFGAAAGENATRNVSVRLKREDVFVIISSGMVNVKNRAGQLLGLNRVMKRLEAKFENPEAVIESLLALMEEFTEKLQRREDVSIIVFRME